MGLLHSVVAKRHEAYYLEMSRTNPECPPAGSPDRLVAAEILLRQEPDEEEEEDEGDGKRKEDDDDDGTDNGYSE
jgi:hypothetical protein